MLNRNQLALFNAVVEEGGFGSGARKLRISQPAVSIQIAQLEDALGVQLFHRTGRGVQLTDAGEALAAFSHRISLLELEAAEVMQNFAYLHRGKLRIGASTTIAAFLLPQLIREYRSRWPEISTDMKVGNSRQIQEQVLDGTIDFGLVEGMEEDAKLEAQVFRDDQLVPIAAPDSSLLKGRRPDLKLFLKQPLILREQGSGTREAVLRFLSGKGHVAEPAYSLKGTETVKGAVAAGLGVSFVSSLTVAGDVMLKRIAVLKLKDASAIRRPFYMIRLRNRKTSPVVDAFLTVLKLR